MYATYRLNSGDLDHNLVEAIKNVFKDKEIETAVYEADETEYLLKHEANRQRLLEAIEHVDNKENLVEVDMEKLK